MSEMNNEVTTHETTAQEFDMTKTATESPRIIAHEFDEVLAEVFNAAAFEDTDAMSDACDVLGVLGLSKYTMFEISGADKESQRHVHRSTKSLRKLVEKYVYCGIAGNPDAPVVHRRSVMMTIKGPSGLVR